MTNSNLFSLLRFYADCEFEQCTVFKADFRVGRQIYSAGAARVAVCQSDKLKSNSSSTMWRGEWMKRSKVDGSPPTRSIIGPLCWYRINTCTARATKTTHPGVHNKNLYTDLPPLCWKQRCCCWREGWWLDNFFHGELNKERSESNNLRIDERRVPSCSWNHFLCGEFSGDEFSLTPLRRLTWTAFTVDGLG